MTVRMMMAETDLDALALVQERIDARLGKILWSMVGLLISVATTCIVILITTGVGQ